MKKQFVIIFLGLCVVFVFLSLHQNQSIGVSNITNGELSFDPNVIRASFEKSIEKEGAEQAYRDMVYAYRDADFDIQHNVAHVLGETLYDTEHIDGIQYCTPTFAFGCYHGFFIRAVSGEGLSIIDKMDAACGTVTEGEPSACRHGIGHGILEYLGSDNLTKALTLCLETTQPDPLAGCTSGVFMEYNVPLEYTADGTFFSDPRPLNNDTPYNPCTNVATRFQASCYHELPQWWVQVYNHDYAKIGSLCAVPDPVLSSACFQGLGGVVAPSAAFDPKETRSYCDEVEDARGNYLCRASAAWSIALNKNNTEITREVCPLSIPEYNFGCPVDSPSKI